jgi:hypothetical protein
LTEDHACARNHCVLEWAGAEGTFWVSRFGGAGLAVNGTAVAQQAQLAPGDQIGVGASLLLFERGGTTSGAD